MGKVLLDESLDELRRSLAGAVVGPADAEYDTVRRCFADLLWGLRGGGGESVKSSFH